MTHLPGTIGVALLCGVLVSPAGAEVADHLKCYKIRDSAPKVSYTADLGGLTSEAGCRIKVPGKMLCVETAKSNLNPPAPVPGSGGATGRFLCYKLKCPKVALAPVPWSDQFGVRSVTPIGAKFLCAPEIGITTTTTSTTSTTSTTLGASCVNGIKDGSETDIDCGGGTCPACAPGQMCGNSADCQSLVCSGGTCQSPSCADAVKNGTETDIDCGGGTCPACGSGQMCLANSDCASNMCSVGMCT